MQIISDFSTDVRSQKPKPGAYEWWYFDAIDDGGRYKCVVIFYEGNPFSPSYIKGIDSGALAQDYPAVSISVYDGNDPIYYSFTEFEAADCFFDESKPEVKVGRHSMKGYIEGGEFVYRLALDEVLPSGDSLRAELEFRSANTNAKTEYPLFEQGPDKKGGHLWNLIQPFARVKGSLGIGRDGSEIKNIAFSGKGYHDHNKGHEPLKEEFEDWYWGRAHFEQYTLVYYLMNKKNDEEHRAWLIDHKEGRVVKTFDRIQLADRSLSLFGMKPARKVGILSDRFEIMIQHSSVLDNGPFYQRFVSDVFLRDKNGDRTESTRALSEYIAPERIYHSIYWPLVNMRIYNKKNGPHWVQKSKTLYRWTW